jgi:hypothetical protein
MKPVQQMLSLRIQRELQVAHVLATVGEEIDLLVWLHALPLEQLKKDGALVSRHRSEPRQSTFPTAPVFLLGPAKAKMLLPEPPRPFVVWPSADIATVDIDLRIVGFVRSHIKATASEVGPSFEYLVA